MLKFVNRAFQQCGYALLTMMAQNCGCQVDEFILIFGNTHIYKNHYQQLELQLSRDSRPLPQMILKPEVKDISTLLLMIFIW
ncbi:thymidylate synthase [Hwangdonia lutea]|uniref:Thymidylate synthase n=1 Tax=Hwangdonia lutea TaxID=3075823 RepID=A0AA97HNL6_9FLAO|nr:thymidylate synthase [Hwangdonia sp. SCSIO 19198]WOD42166.1 thymidylate synthase [Hwangdonia sp. SCSIO 19198]